MSYDFAEEGAPRRAPSFHAFTLIELLVVVAVLALLAAILFPVFARAREKGRQTACMAAARQVGAAFLLYAQDWDGGYPNTGDPYLWVGKRWRWPIMPYLSIGQKQGGEFSDANKNASALLLCPSDTQSGSDYDATSYAYSAAFFHTPEQVDALRIRHLIWQLNTPGPGALCVTRTDADVAQPSHKVLLQEWFNSHEWGRARQPVGFWGTLITTSRPGADRWEGSRVSVFADGHAAVVRASRQPGSVWEDCPDVNRTPGGLNGSDLR